VAEPRPVRKCTCRKSKCLKKYCECLSAGLKCGQWCKCLDCHNCEDKSRLDQMQIEIEVY
jgi:protein lin-54